MRERERGGGKKLGWPANPRFRPIIAGDFFSTFIKEKKKGKG